ncbi:hypothetical protein TNCV_4072011 [Trichonephila clavipes]|uniref:Tc1-like transposase DDE domain-containing protein n=1 Tax=Trichonephila clavipes TaxID=2585209 RepID=A0A8X6W7R5_TRICX|nr:hypothetical protein TNCV_4072011 [Trichonephila clavipes]
MMRVWMHSTDEHRTTRNTSSARRKVTSARDDQHLLCMTVNDRTTSSRQWTACWSTAIRPEVFPFLQGNPGAIFLQDNACPHVAKAVLDLSSAQHMQLFPWPAYSSDTSPIAHVWDLVGWRLAREPRPAASNDELLLRT